MGYVRTAGMSTAARRRRRRTALVLTALLLVLALVFVYAALYYRDTSGETTADDDRTTATATEAPLTPADIKVNVYNATQRSGLAGRTGEALETREYDVQDIADDPERATIEGSAHIRFGPEGEASANALLDLFPQAELQPDERESDEIDLVLGETFEELPAEEGGDAEEADDGDG